MLAIKNSTLVFAAASTAAFFTQSSCSQEPLKINYKNTFENTFLSLKKSDNLNNSLYLYNQGVRNIKCLKIENNGYNCKHALKSLRKEWQTKLKEFCLPIKRRICIQVKNTQKEERIFFELSKIDPKYLQHYAALRRIKIFKKNQPIRPRVKLTLIDEVLRKNNSRANQNSTVRNLKEHNSYKKYLINKKLLKRKRERQLNNS